MHDIPQALREQVYTRSGFRCEAYVHFDTPSGQTTTRCFASPVQVHHRLPRSRGGTVLDKVGETYHLIAVCPTHHRQLEAERSDAYQAGLLIDGQVLTQFIHGQPHPHYTGTDRYLTLTYGGIIAHGIG